MPPDAFSSRVRCADQKTQSITGILCCPHSGPCNYKSSEVVKLMPDYRRSHVPGGTYFFTLKTESNAPIFRNEWAVTLLGDVLRESQAVRPVEIKAIVLLHDHIHAIWSLPRGDEGYSTRWAWIKKEFTKRYLANGGSEQPISDSRVRNRRRGVWQRKFWEHTILDESDFEAHFDYIHWNPVKHGYVECPGDWPHSSFHRWVKSNVYENNWGCGHRPPNSIARIDHAGE